MTVQKSLLVAGMICSLLAFQSPTPAQAYDGLIAPPDNGRAAPSGGGGYNGVTNWGNQPGPTNPYGTAPAQDLYGFVQGSGTSVQDRRQAAQDQIEKQRAARSEEIRARNAERAAAQQERLQRAMEEQQQKQLEIQAQARLRAQQLQQQQYQQQQQRRR